MGTEGKEGVRSQLRSRIMEELDQRRHISDQELYDLIDRTIQETGRQMYLPLKERLWLRSSLYDSFRRLDILQELIDDPEVTEIMVNGAGRIFVEKHGRMELWDRRFEVVEQLEDIIQQIVSRVNRVVNVSSPIVDARLEDGSRVHVVLPPVALDGPAVTIRKFPEPITMEKLLKYGALTQEAAEFLRRLVEARYNIFISGGTGSGKSSLVNLICRLYDVDEGSVCVGGVDVRKYDTEVLRNQVSVVLQKNTLFSGTILDNLRWGNPDATEEECIEACRAACADEFIDRMPAGYETRIERGGANVSGGQKQRLCIARALLKKPKVLILDDSTSAVDTATDASIRAAFAEKIPGTTKIIIAQRVSSVESADRILVLDDGRIDAFDTHENLLKNNAIYQEIYNSQLEGSGDFDQPA